MKSSPPNIELVEHCGNCYWSDIDEALRLQFGDCNHDFTVVMCRKHNVPMHCWLKCEDYIRSTTFAILCDEENENNEKEE